MQVRAYKTIDVDFEAEIETDDILNEFSERVDEVEETYWRRLLPCLDVMTRIMARIKDETIAAMPVEARETLCARLTIQAERYGDTR